MAAFPLLTGPGGADTGMADAGRSRVTDTIPLAPFWKVGEWWKWYTNTSIFVKSTYIVANGTINITYKQDDALSKETVTSGAGGTWSMTVTETEWINGTYDFYPNATGTANGYVYTYGNFSEQIDRSGVRLRNMTNMAFFNSTLSSAFRIIYNRTAGNFRMYDTSGNETHAVFADRPLNLYRFPLVMTESWAIDVNITDIYAGIREYPGTLFLPQNYNGQRSDRYRFTVSVNPGVETKTVPAGTFSDAFKLSDFGTDDWSWQEGVFTASGTSQVDQNRWFSRTAGNSVNGNETTKLAAYNHTANRVPTINQFPSPKVNEETPLVLDLGANVTDPDTVYGDYLVYNLTASPALPSLSFNATTGAASITPAQSDVGTYSLTFTVTDSFSASAQRVFSLEVVNVNDPPFVNRTPTDFAMLENSTAEYPLNLKDIFHDPDPAALDSLTFSISENNAVAATIGDDGTLSFTAPDRIFTTAQAPLVFVLSATDTGSGNDSLAVSVSAALNLTVAHRNHPPLAAGPRDVRMDEDSTAYLNLTDLFSDADISYANDSLTYTVSGNRSVAVTRVTAGGPDRLFLAPAPNWSGVEKFIVNATDSNTTSASVTVTVTVASVNDAPEIRSAGTLPETDIVVPEASNGTAGVVNFAVNATDLDGDALTYRWEVRNATGGVVTKGTTAFLILRLNFTGQLSSEGSPYSVTVTVSDPANANATRRWGLSVTNTNRLPVPKITSPSQNATFTEGRTVTLDATGTADPDGGALGYEWLVDGARAADGKVANWTAKKGSHSITLKVTDAEGEIATASVNVTVKAKDGGGGGGGGVSTILGGGGSTLIIALVAVIACVAVVGGVLLMRRRRPSVPAGLPPPGPAAAPYYAPPPPQATPPPETQYPPQQPAPPPEQAPPPQQAPPQQPPQQYQPPPPPPPNQPPQQM